MTVERYAFTLQLTERCNLACRYCYVRRRGRPDPADCTPDFCRRFVDFVLRQSPKRVKITFFGGEPLLRPDLIRHAVAYGKKAAADRGDTAIGFHLVTNGTLLDDALGDFIAAEGIGLEVSLDGPAEVHDANRIYPDGSPSFHRVYGNLLRFVARHPDHPVSIFSVAASTDALAWLQAFCRGIDAQGFTFNPIHTAPEDHPRSGRCKTVKQAFSRRIDWHQKALLAGDRTCDQELAIHMACLLGGCDACACEAGTNATVTTRTGDIYPCPFFVGHPDQVIGNIDPGFLPERVKPYLDRRRTAMTSCKKCGARRVCVSGCAFNAFEQNGRVDRQAKQACVHTRDYARRLQASLVVLASRVPEKLIETTIAHVFAAALPSAPPMPWDAAPRSFVIRLTGRCNLACDYCYDKGHTAPRDDLDYPAARRIVRHILESPAVEPVVGLFGGEPLLNWEVGEFLITQISRGARQRGKRPFFHLTTNATLMTPRIARTLHRHGVTVQVSVDGNAECHDRHRRYPGGQGSWEAVHHGIGLLKQAGRGAVIDGQVVLTPGHVDMVGAAGHLKEMGCRRISFLVAGWEEKTGLVWSSKEIAALMQARADFFPFFIDSALRGDAGVDLGFAGLVAAEPKGPQGICECGTGEVYLDTQARIYRCPQLYAAGHAPLGRCGQEDDAHIHSPGKCVVREECLACWARTRCGGGCMVRNQSCAWIASRRPARDAEMWCDYMRAEFARAILAYRILESRRPRVTAAIKAMFGV